MPSPKIPVCPFFNIPLRVWKTAIGVFASSDGWGAGWASRLFDTEEALVEALTPRFPAGVVLPAEDVVKTCPFTGKEIVVRPAGEGMFEAVVDGLWVSRPMLGARRVEYLISTRNGIPPVFRDRELVVTVTPAASPGTPIVKALEGDGNVREEIERMVRDSSGERTSVVVDGLRKGGVRRGRKRSDGDSGG
jgi:hypothetical protein